MGTQHCAQRRTQACLILDCMSKHKLHMEYMESIHFVSAFLQWGWRVQRGLSWSEGVPESSVWLRLQHIQGWGAWEEKWEQGGRVSGRRDFLYEGRLGTSERQGNHDNQTTNPGNQLGVLTVIGRPSARQGLIWAENREEETTAVSPINLLYVLYRAPENNNNKVYFQNTFHVLEATVSHRCNNFSSGQEKNCVSETMKL